MATMEASANERGRGVSTFDGGQGRRSAAQNAEAELKMPFLTALKLGMTGQYAVDAWMANSDRKGLREDVVFSNNVVGLVSALCLSFTIPLLMNPSTYVEGFEPGADHAQHLLALGLLCALTITTMTYFVVVLLTMRNLNVCQMVHEEAIPVFVILNKPTLLLPMRMLVLGTVVMLISMLIVGICLLNNSDADGGERWIIFAISIAICVAFFALYIRHVALGVRALYQSNNTIDGAADRWGDTAKQIATDPYGTKGHKWQELDDQSKQVQSARA